jgi:hypothetical protein
MNSIFDKALFLLLFVCAAWIGGIGAYAWINFPAVTSFLSFLSPDGELERPIGRLYFLRVLFLPVYYLVPTFVVLRIFYIWKGSVAKKILVYYFIFFIFHFGVFKYLDITGSELLAEDNAAEWLTFAVSLIASIFFAVCGYLGNRFSILLGIAWFFFAMEEISWGQRILDFTSPELFLKYNFQQEYNFHNFLNPVVDSVYIIINLALLILLTSAKNFSFLQKFYQSSGFFVISRSSEKFALWLFPCMLVMTFIFLPIGQQPHEFVEQQWAILGFCISFLTLKELKI